MSEKSVRTKPVKKGSADDSTKKKKKKKKNIFLRILAGIGLGLGLIVVAFAGLIAGSLAGYVEDTELIDVENMRLNLTSFVYVQDAETGEYVEYEKLYDTENRIWVEGSKIPEHLKNAFVAIEDERFYSHKGIDLKRFFGATVQYLSNKGSSSYGGSTITQQLIKNLTQDDDYSIKRKVQEVYRAYNLEKELSKDEILEYYLNTIYLSQNCNGVESASLAYFGKHVSELSLAESTVLAGITKYPTKYDPLINPESNRERQLVILKKMLDLGFITKGEYETAKNEEITFMPPKSEQEQHIQTYYTDATIDQVIEDLMTEYNYSKEYAQQILFNGGLKIYLAMDPKIQQEIDAVYSNPSAFQRAAGEVQPQSSMVIMDPYTGLVKGLVGGRGEKEANRTLNRATQTLRQPGSTIKPLTVYAPSVEYGLVTPSSVVNDAPVKFGGWEPRNDNRKFMGRITVATALKHSRNVPATKICNYLTTAAAYDFMKNNLHFDTLVKSRMKNGIEMTDINLAPIALGGLTDGVRVIDMCAAYCTFPNGGRYIKPSLYTKVVDSKGNVVLEHDTKGQVAMSETTSRDMVSMLQNVVTGGTGTAAALPGMRAAGKTGTTSSNHDRWFVGFTPYYVGAVWFGYDQPATLRGFSPNPAAVAWRKVMTAIHKDLPNKAFFADDTDEKYSIMLCADSEMRATPACKNLISKTFAPKDVPKKRCTEHPYQFNKNELNSGKVKATNSDSKKNEDTEETDETQGTDTPIVTVPSGDVQIPNGNAGGVVPGIPDAPVNPNPSTPDSEGTTPVAPDPAPSAPTEPTPPDPAPTTPVTPDPAPSAPAEPEPAPPASEDPSIPAGI